MTESGPAWRFLTAGLAAAVVAVLAWLYTPTLEGLALEWVSSPDSSYGAILVAVAAATIWSRRAPLLAAAREPARPSLGFFLTLFGLFAYLVGFLGADVFVTRVSFVIVCAGLFWLAAGTKAARLLAAPGFFVLLAIPLPALVVNAITLPLQLVASQLAEGMLGLARIPVFRDGNILELSSTSLEVAEACSGLRSAISLTAMACLLAWASKGSGGRRVAVIAAAVPIAIVLNGVRIAATGVACEIWGPAAADGRWHTFTGWITFVVALVILMRLERALTRWRRAPQTLVSGEMASA